jgi:inorganic pyrophosphatase
MRDLHTLNAFVHDDIFHVVVESPRGSAVKLKYDPKLGAMSVSRPLNLGVTFPFDWGFVPSTKSADGDPIDALVYWDVSSYPGVVIPCRALAVIEVDQRGGEGKGRVRNDRVVAVPFEARREKSLTLADDLPPRVRDELNQFFLRQRRWRARTSASSDGADPTKRCSSFARRRRDVPRPRSHEDTKDHEEETHTTVSQELIRSGGTVRRAVERFFVSSSCFRVFVVACSVS